VTPPRSRGGWPVALLAVALLAGACATESSAPVGPASDRREPCAARDELRKPLFGDLHVHTTLSFDAHAFEVRVTPDEAWRFARGESVLLPPLDAEGRPTRSVRIDRPLDFAALTDHSEFLGEVETCTTPGSAAYDSKTCRTYREAPDTTGTGLFGIQVASENPRRYPDVCGEDGLGCSEAASAVWRRVQEAAEAAYDRSSRCEFTSFVAYEYTAATGASTNHRNVIFRNARVPFPTTYFEQPTPQGLWSELRSTCLDAGQGCDVLAIPHNPNESNGNMFRVEYPGATGPQAEREQAAFRARMEPLLEIFQHKGDSECRTGLSGIVGGADEQCEFEKWTRPGPQDCGDGTGSLGSANYGCYSRRDFLRGILLEGLKEEARIGENPYRLGVIASTDTHNGTPGRVAEDEFGGHRGTDDDTPQKQLGPGVITAGGIAYDPGGLAGVWAEENSRDAIFDALRRRETFGTSGPRIAVRLFAGADLPSDLCEDPEMVRHAYDRGTPMGGTLPATDAPPRILVSALRDAGTPDRPGTPLQRIQVVKGWIDREDGLAHEQVFDVAGDAGNGATVDEATCETRGPGADSLCAVWTDPDWDPRERAFYYARVLENPTCRWSTWSCNRLPAAERPATCGDPSVKRTQQERAWTSPVFVETRA